MVRLSKNDQIRISFYTRSNLNVDEELKLFHETTDVRTKLICYARIRQIVLLGTVQEDLTQYNISPTQLEACRQLKEQYEGKANLQKEGPQLFAKQTANSLKELCNLFKTLLLTDSPQQKLRNK